ncbi:DUF6259 domain-containing protein [Arthrobacter sp. CJ23]|uniref:DUF6259 domain-containing protein n=1 Tax=Arthrobacter sp. CJ23 TaxID=2972479 RepID=UPI00215C441D|nr:DUF6259 domain-containing protein [Arthrobacter sp. CJ23]UVJ39229.1 DUF6259 domain-containing protein [Arthrobacter sp. CJ23]
MIAEDGTRAPVAMTVNIASRDGELVFTAHGAVGNADGLVVGELTLPLLALEHGAGTDRQSDVLYRPDGLGRRTPNPWAMRIPRSTEYMAADHKEASFDFEYPGEFSMAWQGLETGDHFLYLGRHDSEFRGALFSVGTRHPGDDDYLTLSTTALPLAASTSRFDVPPIVVRAERGDWRTGAARYRRWADEWYAGPRPGDGIRGRAGWQRVILKHQHGEILYRYSDLVDIYESGLQSGISALLVFGWWAGGFDRGYPTYEPDPLLGGREELEAAIAEIHSRGGLVTLYANGNLIDRRSDYFAERGKFEAKKDMAGHEYTDGYYFADRSKRLRSFTGPDFTQGCHGAAGWRETMADVAASEVTLGTDSLFFDQIGFHRVAWPCFDQTHEHGAKTDIEAKFRIQTLESMAAVEGVELIGSEGVADCFIQYLDYHHGCGFAFRAEDDAFPHLFRESFPEAIISNRGIHDERDDWERQLSYAFVFNLVFDVAIHRARGLLSELPHYGTELARLTALRSEHAAFFESGVFHAPDQAWDSPLIHVQYGHGDKILDLHWNSSRTDVLTTGAGVLLEPNEITLTVRAAHSLATASVGSSKAARA